MASATAIATSALALYSIYSGEESRRQQQASAKKASERQEKLQAQQEKLSASQQADSNIDLRNEQLAGNFQTPYLKTTGQPKGNRDRMIRPTLSPRKSLMLGHSRGFQPGYNKQTT
tara:strand:- start:1316 stop:1663 length:348 start_codon:yes stop_codon:yes gene_type:complete